MQRIYLLRGKVQHYSWGGFGFIPALLGMKNEKGLPFAEYWMGAHPSHSSSLLIDNNEVLLSMFLEQRGEEVLGNKTFQQFGGLPYLFKILDVRQMLSIQVHPTKEEARKGFEQEDAEGISISAAHRNYKDRNHKPEMMVALSDFWLLHGFKSEAKLAEQLEVVPELRFLQPIFKQSGYSGLFSFVMGMEPKEVNEHLHHLAQRVLPLYEQNKLEKSSEDFWAARAIKSFCTNGNYDRGIFCIYLFNLLHLKKGEAVFQPAGMPHAYLEGQNVEIMANSDNVLRAGLTDKHIDVPELLKHTLCHATEPNILMATGSATDYASCAAEFALHQYNCIAETVSFTTKSAEIIIVLKGSVRLGAGDEEMVLQKGESAFLIAGTDAVARCDSDALFFRAAAGSA